MSTRVVIPFPIERTRQTLDSIIHRADLLAAESRVIKAELAREMGWTRAQLNDLANPSSRRLEELQDTARRASELPDFSSFLKP